MRFLLKLQDVIAYNFLSVYRQELYIDYKACYASL